MISALISKPMAATVFALALVTIAPIPAFAGEVRVLTAGAFKPIVAALAPEFQKATGHTLHVQNDTAGGLAKRVLAGELFDVIVAPPAALDQMRNAGKLDARNAMDLVRVGVGVAVKEGAPLPDISTTAAFKDAITKAKAVAYIDPAAGGTSGIYVHKLFERLGLADIVKAKAVLVPGGLVAAKLVTGEAEIALHQVSEILAVPGTKLIGELPIELQSYTVYSVALSAAIADKSAADAFVNELLGARASSIFGAKGMQRIIN